MDNIKLAAALLAGIAVGAGGAKALKESSPELDACRAMVAKADAPQIVTAADAPELVAAVPAKAGKLVACEETEANIDPGTPQARKATMRCVWDVGGNLVDDWLQPEDAAKVKEIKDKTKEPKP